MTTRRTPSPRFGERRHVRDRIDARGRGDAEHAELAGLGQRLRERMGLNMNGMWPPATSLIAGDMPL